MLQTPLEIYGGWYTSKQRELDFYNALVADSPRIAFEQIGAASGDATPIYLVRIGATAPPTAGNTDSCLVLGMQHGSETASRESVIQFIRDMVYTTDPDDVAYLTAHPLFIIPTVNAGQIGTAKRENANGIDTNRDHVSLTQPETRAVADAIRLVKPRIIVDVHENNDTGVDIQFGSIEQPQAATQVRDLSTALRQAVSAHLVGLGRTTATYLSGTHAGIMHNLGGLRHIPTVLTETDRTSGMTTPQRIELTLHSLKAIRDWHETNATSIPTAAAAAKSAKAAEGSAATTPFRLSAAVTLNPPPSAYWITQAQRDAIDFHLTTFDIETTPSEGGYLVSMGQPAQPVIPFLLDESSEVKAVTAERRYPAAPEPEPGDLISPTSATEWGPLRIGGVAVDVTSVQMRVAGQLTPIWTRP
jgi:hypothetical protein